MTSRMHANSSRGRRGSVFILVVAVLSVLVMLTLTLSYVSRMDLLASRNYGNMVQSRMAAITGVPVFWNSNNSAAALAPAQGATQQTASVAPVANQSMGLAMEARRATAGTMNSMNSMGSLNPMNRMGAYGLPSYGSRNETLTPVKMELELQAGREAGMAMSPSPLARAAAAGPGVAEERITASGMRSQRATRSRTGANTLNGASLAGVTSTTSENLAAALIEDESAKININAVVPDGVTDVKRSNQFTGGLRTVLDAPDRVTESMLAKLIAEVASARQLGGIDAQALAHRIALRRYGKDGRPGRAYTDDNANNGMTDPRRDGIDNDGDGQIDEEDELQIATAHDGLDNNRNGVIDEPGETIAQDGLDNNHDGQIDEGSEAIDDPAEASSDPRKPALGDDTPYGGLEELMSVDGMTPALYRVLNPYLTVFSVSFAAYASDDSQNGRSSRRGPGPDASEALAQREQGRRGRQGAQGEAGEAAQGMPQIDPNTAPPELLYQVLKQRFADASDDLLGQFIANLIDRRDLDSVPTTIKIGSKNYTGIEINPCINEICPDPTPGENNDGQFIELYNPWSQPVSLAGWSLRGQGIQTGLNFTIPSGGFLVLTNDINNENDESPEDEGNEGSFYNVFHKVGTGGQHQLVEIRGMNLSVGSGTVQLVNAQGMVVDEFTYRQGQSSGATRSFQRKDPRLRTWQLLPATPLEMNQGAAPTPQDLQTLKIMEQWQNQPFRSPLDVMLVSTAFDSGQTGAGGTSQIAYQGVAESDDANGGAGEAQVMGGADASDPNMQAGGQRAGAGNTAAHAYAMPQLTKAGRDNLDVRLVDCFRIGAVVPQENDTVASDLVGTQVGANGTGALAPRRATPGRISRRGRVGQLMMTGMSQESASAVVSASSDNAGEAELPEAPRCQTIFGRVNLNTASAAVLATLPGMDAQLAAKIVAVRESALADGMDQNGWTNSRANTTQATGALLSAGATSSAWWLAESPFAQPHWANLSDFLKDEDLWEGRPLYDRLDAVYSFSQLVTMHTMSVLVATASRPSEPVEAKSNGKTVELVTKSGKRPSVARTQRIIAGDRGAPETVSFKFVGNYGEKQIDPDAMYAAPANKIQPMDLKTLMAKVEKAGGKVGPGMTATRAQMKAATGQVSTGQPRANMNFR